QNGAAQSALSCLCL
ncbi:C4-dicarboxylate anaerobic carrier family protein, partial [Vibrio parahaemolyticus V-223/04]